VGAGNVMADIIESKVINIVTLTNTFRQAEGSKIIEIANKVRNNQTFELIKTSDFFGTIQNDVNSYILRCWISKYGKIKDLDTLYNDFQICTSSRRRCNEINNIIRSEMKNQPILMFNKDCGFSLNDKVMNTKNDYTNDIYNGEFGRIEKITYKLGEMDFEIKTNEELKKYYDNKTFGKSLNFVVYYSGLNKSVSYELANDELENFQLAYCCTIHKLQGSEFQTVLCDVSEFNMITDSRLLYTAITRAKNLFVLVSNEKTTIDKIIKNKLSSKRKTLLVERLDPTKETKEIDNISGNGFIIN
jgi:exodeoxyribonuclease V alpha subunit